MKNNISKIEDFEAIGDKDIKYIDLYYFVIRNAKVLIKLIGVGLILSLIYTIRLKNIWGGEFQIVLENDMTNLINESENVNNRFRQLLKGAQPDQLLTEVEILKSPSVLMPIFEIVKKRELSLGNKQSYTTFNRWKKDLTIVLQEGTNILNIKYENPNKRLILPTLISISDAYQEYSSKNKNDNISKGMAYLKKQIAEYKVKTRNSYKKAQKFSVEQDLNVVQGLPPNFGAPGNLTPNFNSPVQDVATEAALKKRNLFEILKYFQEEQTDDEKLVYISKLNNFADKTLFEKLNLIELQISETNAFYTKNSNKLKQLLEKKSAIINKIKVLSLKNLLARIDSVDTIINSSKRPKGVFVKFNDLNNNYLRDNYTLLELESQYRLLSLEKAKDNDPWKLITKPTVLDERVSPNRTRLMLLYGFFVVLLSLMYAYIKEKSTNKIFTKDYIERNFPYPILEEVPDEKSTFTNFYLKIIADVHLKNLENVRIFKIGNINNDFFEELILKLKKYSKSKIEKNNNLAEFNQTYNYLFIAQSAEVTKEDFENLIRRIGANNDNIIGLIFLNNKIYFNETTIKI